MAAAIEQERMLAKNITMPLIKYIEKTGQTIHEIPTHMGTILDTEAVVLRMKTTYQRRLCEREGLCDRQAVKQYVDEGTGKQMEGMLQIDWYRHGRKVHVPLLNRLA